MKSRLKLAVFLAMDLVALGAVDATSPKMPTFFARRDYPGLFNSYVQVADTNGDGIPDLIASQVGFIEVLFGNGDGTFRPGPTTLTVAGGAVSFVATDLNGDGHIDLALGNGNGIVLSTGNGDGTFQPGVLYPVNDSQVAYLMVGDFNGDGILDIATGGQKGVWLLTGKGNGTFNSAVLAVSLPGSFNIASADFNGDGKPDFVVTLLIGQTGAGFAVLLGNGNGTFQPPQTFSYPKRPIAVAVGSLTKGGPPSIAVNQTLYGKVFLYFGNGAGGFSGPKQVSLPGANSDGLLIGDINGDGRPDLVSDSGYVAYGVGGGNFTAPVSYAIDGAFAISNVVLADLRKNGLTDIVTGGYAAISVLLNESKGRFEDGIWTSVTGGAGCGVKADFNRDGKPDLAVNNSQGISILLGTGIAATPFAAGTSIALAGAGCLVTGDLNGDGIADLLVPVNGTVVAYLGNGDGTFTFQSTTPTPSGGYLAVGDFNHDGKLDFATSGNLLALGNGDGTFQAPANIVASPPSTGFSGIAAGDINNDGWPDLVLTNNGIPYSNVFVLLNNHQGGFMQVPTSFGALTAQPILADLNGDGKLDLILGGGSGAFVSLGKGTGMFTSPTGLPGLLGTNGVNCVADVNGDGIPDILISGADTLFVYLGAGGATYATPFAIGTGPAPGDILVEYLHGQSVVGLPDIVVPDTSGGVTVLLNLTR